MDTQTVLLAIGTLLGIATFAAAAFALIRGSGYKGAIEILKADNDALRGRVDTLEKSEERNKTEIESLKRENGILLSQRPSHDLLVELTKSLQLHHTATMELLVPHE